MLNMDQYSDSDSDEESPVLNSKMPGKVEAAGKAALDSPAPRTASPRSEPAAEPTPTHERLTYAEAAQKTSLPPWRQMTNSATTRAIVPMTTGDAGDSKIKKDLAANKAKKSVWNRQESRSNPGRFYYVNAETGKTVWTKPEEEMDAESDRRSEGEPEAEASAEDSPQHFLEPSVPGLFNVAELMRWRGSTGCAAAPILYAAQVVVTASTSSSAPAPKSPIAEGSWRMRSETAASESGSWRARVSPMSSPVPATPLSVSDNSWAAQQRARRNGGSSPTSAAGGGDAEVVRSIKSLLNKLTVEKFPQISKQLTECGYNCTSHVRLLIKEIFEKATTQHHYIEMYSDLCELFHNFFNENPVSDDPTCSFKRLLLNECQTSFERNLAPPPELGDDLDFEERTVAEVKYKTRMLGNIRFVGALLSRYMLASKVLIAILEELMGDPTPEALESVALLLTVTGPTFDNSEWAHKKQLNAMFSQLKDMAQKQTCCPRARCLIKDLLDLRKNGWQTSRPVRQEAPTTLQGVAEKAKEEEQAKWESKWADQDYKNWSW